MEIHFEITEEDFIQFNFYHIENSPSQQRMIQGIRFLLPLLMTVPIYLIGTRIFNQPSVYWLVIAILFAVGWMVFYPKIFQRTIRKQLLKAVHEGDNSTIYGKKTMKVDGDQVTIIGKETTETFSRQAIKNIKAYDDMILLYMSAVSAQIIPVRDLSTAEIKFLMNELKWKEGLDGKK